MLAGRPAEGHTPGRPGSRAPHGGEAPVMAGSPALGAHYLVEVGGSQHALPEKEPGNTLRWPAAALLLNPL